MPRYFFHVNDGRQAQDRVGSELPSLADARREAVTLAGLMLAYDADEFWNNEAWRMEVTNGDGMILFTLDFVATEAPTTHRRRSAFDLPQ